MKDKITMKIDDRERIVKAKTEKETTNRDET